MLSKMNNLKNLPILWKIFANNSVEIISINQIKLLPLLKYVQNIQ